MPRSLWLLSLGVAVFIGLGFALPYLLPDEAEEGAANVTLLITRDYGRALLQRSEFNASLGLTAMEMLRNTTQIETRYGGLYLHSAFGLESSVPKRLDWFYYVNGAYMDRGLASYRPRSGEVVQVDYHFWGVYSGSPGFLSGFPGRLTHGLGGRKENLTLIGPAEYARDLQRLGRSLSSKLDLNYSVLYEEDALVERLRGNVIVLADPDHSEFYLKVLALRGRSFWPSSYDEGKLMLNDVSGKDGRELSDGFSLQARDLPGGGWVMLVFATEESWAREAVEMLSKGESLGHYAAIAVGPGGVTALPV